jgi:hypothetical protein
MVNLRLQELYSLGMNLLDPLDKKMGGGRSSLKVMAKKEDPASSCD